MLVVYIAGTFRADNAWLIEQNIRRAEALALEVWLTGIMVPICPHAANRFYQGAGPDDIWLKGDLELLARADAILVVPGSEHSSGTAIEVKRAGELHLPVYNDLETLKIWAERREQRRAADKAAMKPRKS